MAQNNNTDEPELSPSVSLNAPGAPALSSKAPVIVAKPVVVASEPVAKTEPLQDITIQPLSLDTPQSDAAIDDIVAQEADEVLAAEDAGLAQAQLDAEAYEEPPKHGHPVFWFFVVLLVIVAIIAAVVLTNPNLSLPFSG